MLQIGTVSHVNLHHHHVCVISEVALIGLSPLLINHAPTRQLKCAEGLNTPFRFSILLHLKSRSGDVNGGARSSRDVTSILFKEKGEQMKNASGVKRYNGVSREMDGKHRAEERGSIIPG